MEPERGAEVNQIERAWRGDDRHDAGPAEIQREVPQDEAVYILIHPLKASRALFRRQRAITRQADDISPRLEHEQNARQQFGALELPGERFRAFLAQQQAQICRGVGYRRRGFGFCPASDLIAAPPIVEENGQVSTPRGLLEQRLEVAAPQLLAHVDMRNTGWRQPGDRSIMSGDENDMAGLCFGDGS